jgi:Tfp pilus assembly protein PilF
MLLFQRLDLVAAEHHARNAVRLAPLDPLSHNLMGMILTEVQRPQCGEFHYRRVIELARARDPIVLANLAWNLKGQGRLAEARQLYEESVAAAPDVFQTWLGWGQLEEAAGNFAAARSRLDRAAGTHSNDSNRSATLAAFGPLAELEGTALISLQKGTGQADIGGYFGRAPLLNLGAEIADRGARPHRIGGHRRGASGGSDGQARLDHAALRTRLALAPRSHRQPVVSDRASIQAVPG